MTLFFVLYQPEADFDKEQILPTLGLKEPDFFFMPILFSNISNILIFQKLFSID